MSLDIDETFAEAYRPDEDQARDARYPIGRAPTLAPGERMQPQDRNNAIDTLARFPELLRNAVQGLSTDQNDTPYRDGGWTVRQLVHHIADSHSIAVFRFRLALTENWPTISGYPEAEFAKLHDYLAAPVEWSLEMIEASHARWVMLLQSLTDEQWKRGYVHPERGRSSLEGVLLLYQWHAQHHLAHITHLRADRGW
jgi:hypothetical protein